MPAFTVDWFIGSIVLPQQDFTANGFACSIPAGRYYLRQASGGRSLIGAFSSEIEDQTGVAAVGTTIKRSRLIVDEWAAPVSVTWGSAIQLRGLFGHTGNLLAAVSHTAPNVSPLLWSPGYPGNTKTIRGVDGYLVPHQAMSKSDDGTQLHTYHFSEETHQDVEWSHLDPSRLRVATGTGGGTFYEFHRQVAMLGARHLYYQDIVEDETDSTTDVTWTTERGPYVLRAEGRSGDWYRRNVPNAEVSSPLSLPMQMLSEYA